MTTQTLTAEPTEAPAAAMRPPRRTASELLAAKKHVHLVSDGMTRCLNRRCDTGTQLLQGLV